ncbi:hypothetical protein D3C77_646440 [compost metagenome]
MIDVTGQQNLLGFNPTLGGDDSRVIAMDNLQHLGVFEDQRTQVMRRARFAQAQVERVQVQVAQVFQGTQVQRALQVFGHGLLVEQLHLIAHAPALRLSFEGLQFTHV